jgi:acyl-coenzyme A thioesterase 9
MYLDPICFFFYEYGQVSNTFYFTFTVKKDALKNALKLRNVVPATEEEARRILERMDAEKLYDGSQ